MSFRSRLQAIERARSAPAAALRGMACFEARECFNAEVDQWQQDFIAGKYGPFPVDPAPIRGSIVQDQAFMIAAAKTSACVKARLDELIGPLAYLPRMTDRERFDCDVMCGLLFAIDSTVPQQGTAADEPFPWPEWARWQGIAFEQWLASSEVGG